MLESHVLISSDSMALYRSCIIIIFKTLSIKKRTICGWTSGADVDCSVDCETKCTSSARHRGAWLDKDEKTKNPSLKLTHLQTESQCNGHSTGKMWSPHLDPVRSQALTACMCPVDPVCHKLTCHRHLFSISRTRNRPPLVRCLRPLTLPYQPHPPVNVHYLHIYGMPDVSRGGVRIIWIRFMWQHFTNFSPCVRCRRAWSPLLTFDNRRR